jgi:hypothetical protein
MLKDLLDPKGFLGLFLQDLYIAEVFLSLDAAGDGEAFLRKCLGQAETEAAKLSHALVLGQILLLEKKHGAYVDLAAGTLLPLLVKISKPSPAGATRDFLDPAILAEFAGWLGLAPLCAPEFVSGLRKKQVESLLARWSALRLQAGADGNRRLIDLILAASYQALDREDDRRQVAERLKNTTSLMMPELFGQQSMQKGIVEWRKEMQKFLRQW